MLTWVNSYKSLNQHLDVQLPWQQIKMRNLYNFFLLDGGLLNNHLKKCFDIYKNVLSKYLQWDTNKDLFSLFSL